MRSRRTNPTEIPPPAGLLEHHDFVGNPLKPSQLEQLTRGGWIEVERFPATAEGLARAARAFERLAKAEGTIGVALWVGPSLAACQVVQSFRKQWRCGPPASPRVVLSLGEKPRR